MKPSTWTRAGAWAAGAGAAGVGLALFNRFMSQRAEQAHPPRGRFLRVANVQLHYVEAGKGTPVVILHGNGGMIADLEISGLIGHAGKRGRAIAFDRPGFGYSTRPDDREWSPEAQAAVIAKALEVLGVTKGAVVIGHSWGTLVAQALALNDPTLVGHLILASGYYFPTLRSDTYMLGPPSYPVVGRVLRHTVAPIIGRATARAMIKHMFAPDRITRRFAEQFPVPLTLRPSQIQAFSEDTRAMPDAAARLARRHAELRMPIEIICGAEDQIVDVDRQSRRLNSKIAHSRLTVIPNAGHMFHHTSPIPLLRLIDDAVQAGQLPAAA
jgi:pimeloyl-ACP methyl ester carboxylesterase